MTGKKRNIIVKTINLNQPYFEILKSLLKRYNPVEKVEGFHNALQSHRGLKGGVGAGKTYSLAADDILVSFLNSPHIHLSTSPSYDNALVTVVPTLIKICEENDVAFDWFVSKNLFRLIHRVNGIDRVANIMIFGADSPKFLKGINAASGSMNEPFSQKKEAFKIWWERIRVKAARLSRTWAGTAEPDKMQWGWEYFNEETIETGELFAATISTYDNKHLPREYVKGLEGIYDEKLRQVYMLGKCINLTEGKAYYSFEKSLNTFKQSEIIIKPDYEQQVIISFDFNVNPMCAVEIVFDTINSISLSPAYYLVKDYKIPSSKTGELCDIIIDNIKDRYDFKNTSFIITGDASGVKTDTRNEFDDYAIIMQKFKEFAGYQEQKGIVLNITKMVEKTNPMVRDRINYVNNLFEKRRLFINEDCKDTIEDFNLVTWKKGAEKFSLDKSQRNLTHLSDAVGYAVCTTKQFIYQHYLTSDRVVLLNDKFQRQGLYS